MDYGLFQVKSEFLSGIYFKILIVQNPCLEFAKLSETSTTYFKILKKYMKDIPNTNRYLLKSFMNTIGMPDRILSIVQYVIGF